jgi:hypothetical protein
MEVRNEPPERSRRVRIGCFGVLSGALSSDTGLPVRQVRRESENAADTANGATVNDEARTGNNGRGSANTVASAGRMDTTLKRLMYIAAAIGYGIMPIDLIPDVVPVLGWTDDVAVGIIALILAFRRKGRK